MADDLVKEPTENKPQPPDAEAVSDDYVVTLGGKPQYLRFPGKSEKYYILIGHAGGDDEELQAAEFEFAGLPKEGADFSQTPVRVRIAKDIFVQKCLAQIRDYCLPVRPNAQSDPEDRRYNTTNDGDNPQNRAIYQSFEGNLRTLIEGAMDKVAGRTTAAARDVDALLAGPPPLLTDT